MEVWPYNMPGALVKAQMGADLHFVPDVHVLYVGPIECARHSFSNLAGDEHASYLITTDVQEALGSTEDLVMQAVEELLATRPNIRAIMLATACQTPFLGIDLDQLCAQVSKRFCIGCCRFEANRMAACNTPGPTRKNIPGCDRYHTRKALMGMLSDAPTDADGGVALLGCSAVPGAGGEPVLNAAALGRDWVLATGSLERYEQFKQLAAAELAVCCNVTWREAAEYLQQRYGMPWLYLPYSYSLLEIDGYYRQIEQVLGMQVDVTQARSKAQAAIAHALEAAGGQPLDLNLAYVSRPWSLVEALLEYGFEVGAVTVEFICLTHMEEDDLPAFQRLKKHHPNLVEQAQVANKPHGAAPARVVDLANRGPMGKYDEQGRPQGFGKRSQRRLAAEKGMYLDMRDGESSGLLMPGSQPFAWELHPVALGEQAVWGYASIVTMMDAICSAAEAER